MKYIMLEVQIGSIKRYIPIIFPDILVHIDIEEAIRTLLESKYKWIVKVVSAGEFNNIMCDCTIGNSTTLNLKSDPIDAEIINEYPYMRGIGEYERQL